MNKEQVIADSIPVTNTMKRLKIETPLGSIESDSGNHWIDVATIVGVVLVLYVGKKLIDKFFRGEK